MEIGSAEWARLITEGARSLGLVLESGHIQRFAVHAGELLKWNAVTNLTAITRPEEIALNHFVDSLAPAGFIPANSSVLDVGSGGGFPGLPLHVVVPGLKTTLLDASRKKVSFLRHVIRALGLRGIEAHHNRIEDFCSGAGGCGRYHVIVSRAYSALAIFVRQVLPLLHAEGRIIAYKANIPRTEMQELQALVATDTSETRLEVEEQRYMLPGLRMERTLLIVRRRGPASTDRFIRSG